MYFFLQLQASSGEGAFVSVLFSLLTLAFFLSPPATCCSGRQLTAQTRGGKRDVRKVREMQRCDEKGKALGENQEKKPRDTETQGQ